MPVSRECEHFQRPPALSPDLSGLSDEELANIRRNGPSQIAAAAGGDAARDLYRQTLLPLEREAVFRQQLDDPNAEVDLLFITVGNQSDTPIAAGLRWRATHTVLLHSASAKEPAVDTARELAQALDDADRMRFDAAEKGFRALADRIPRDCAQDGRLCNDPMSQDTNPMASKPGKRHGSVNTRGRSR